MNQPSKPARQSTEKLHRRFEAALPTITRVGRTYFRHLKPEQKEEAISEMIALSWKYFRRLVQRGKKPEQFIKTFAKFAARAVANGRRLCGQRTLDALCRVAQRKHGFRVESLPLSTTRSHHQLFSAVRGQHLMDVYEERLQDNSQTPVPDQVQFRLDWIDWLITRTERDRRIIDDMALNRRTLDLAHKFGISPSRISQLRRDYHNDWTWFCSVSDDEANAASSDAV